MQPSGTPPKIFVAGHRGMVGSAIVRALQSQNAGHILTRTRAELDLLNQAAVGEFFAHEQPDQVYLGRRARWVASTPTTPTQQISSTKT